MIEEHGAGRQLLRPRTWPSPSRLALGLAGVLAVLATMAHRDGAWMAGILPLLGAGAGLLLVHTSVAAAQRGWDLALGAYAREAELTPVPAG